MELYDKKILLYFDSRRKGGPSPTFLPLEKLVVRTINVLLMRPCLFNHLRARGIHVSIYNYNKPAFSYIIDFNIDI